MGESPAQPDKGGERSEPVSRIVFMPYDTDSQSRNVLASPLGEEGHEVAKGWTVVRMIMILDVDVTAERRHYNTHRPAGDTTTLGAKGPVKLKNPPAAGRFILRTFPFTTLRHNPRRSRAPSLKSAAKPPPQPSGPKAPSNLRTLRPSGRSILRTLTPKACPKAHPTPS